MPSVDSNGIAQFSNTDMLTPLASNLNAIGTSVSAAFNANIRIWPVANTAARTALVTSIGAANITTAKPLFVWRADATGGRNLEFSTNGTSWSYYTASNDDTGWYTPAVTWNTAVTDGAAVVRTRRVGNVVSIAIDPVNLSFTSGVSGNITNNTILTLPADLRPAMAQPLSPLASGRIASFYVGTGGAIVITAIAPTATWTANVTVNEGFSIGGTYLLG